MDVGKGSAVDRFALKRHINRSLKYERRMSDKPIIGGGSGRANHLELLKNEFKNTYSWNDIIA